MFIQNFHRCPAFSRDQQEGDIRSAAHKKLANYRSLKLHSFCFQWRRMDLLDLEHLLNVGNTNGLLEGGHGAVGHALDVGVDSLDGDALLDEREGLADGADDLGREAVLDLGEELVGEGLVKRSLDLCFYSQPSLIPPKLVASCWVRDSREIQNVPWPWWSPGGCRASSRGRRRRGRSRPG